MKETSPQLEPYMLAVLPKKFDAIVNEMNHALQKSARSGVANLAKDLACIVLTNDARVLSIGQETVLIMSMSASLAVRPMTRLFEDIKPGDCFLNNSPYYGVTHHADFTYLVPVFYKGEHVFTCMAAAHQADIGNSQPTTFMTLAKDLYEEGSLDFPCVRVQRNYKDIEDILRMCRARIRNPEIWYGDYLAAVGAARTGERRLVQLCDEYGVDTVKEFIKEWMDYSRQLTVNEIKKFPSGTWKGETMHDPVPGIAPEGIPIRAKVTIEADKGKLTVDVTDNIDCVEAGFNMGEAAARSAILAGVFYNLDPDIPHNDAAFDCVSIIYRPGSAIGGLKPPFSASSATTFLNGRLTNVVQSIFAKIGQRKGLAEGSCCFGPSASAIASKDYRFGGRPTFNAILYAFSGGPGLYGHDGWILYLGPQGGGTLGFSSAEILELQNPIIVECCEIEPDSCGAGQWDGAPSIRFLARPLKHPATWFYESDSRIFPPKGVCGGQSGGPFAAWKVTESGETLDLPNISVETIKPDERIGSLWAGGGGYGSPLDRDPEKVKWRVRNGWLSLEKALQVYGVVIDTDSEEYEVDYEATRKCRKELKRGMPE